MKGLLTFVILISGLCVSVASQKKLTEVDLTLSGIRSGSTIQQVRKLGKPSRIEVRGLDECAELYARTLYFPGLKVGLLGSKNGGRMEVFSITVTSARWTIAPGLRIGAARKTVLQKFGRPVAQDDREISYVTKGNMGMVSFRFTRSRLVRVEMMETLC